MRKTLNTQLIDAVFDGNRKEVVALLDKGADVNAKTPDKHTPLSIATNVGTESLVRLLVKRGADVNSQTIYGDTPIFPATQKGRESIVRLFIQRGAEVDVDDERKALVQYAKTRSIKRMLEKKVRQTRRLRLG